MQNKAHNWRGWIKKQATTTYRALSAWSISSSGSVCPLTAPTTLLQSSLVTAGGPATAMMASMPHEANVKFFSFWFDYHFHCKHCSPAGHSFSSCEKMWRIMKTKHFITGPRALLLHPFSLHPLANLACLSVKISLSRNHHHIAGLPTRRSTGWGARHRAATRC